MNLDDCKAEPVPELYAPWPWTPEYPNIKELDKDRTKEKRKKEKN